MRSFFQFPLSPGVSKLFGVRVKGHNLKFTSMPMGWTKAARVVQATLLSLLRPVGLSSSVGWLNNLLVVGDLPDNMDRKWAAVVARMECKESDVDPTSPLLFRRAAFGPILRSQLTTKSCR
eukprot:Sspe_Gene.104594::Locus_81167_Transcript_1_1_Confidence_1.000_Length_653::g.104594::m.104594